MEVPERTGWQVGKKKHIETNFHFVGCWNIPIHTSETLFHIWIVGIYSIYISYIYIYFIYIPHIAEIHMFVVDFPPLSHLGWGEDDAPGGWNDLSQGRWSTGNVPQRAIQWDHQGWRFCSVKGCGFMREIQIIRLVGSCIPRRYWLIWLNFSLYFLLWKAELGIPWLVQSIFWRHPSWTSNQLTLSVDMCWCFQRDDHPSSHYIINTNPTLISHVSENPVYFVYFPITIPIYHHQFSIPSHSQMFCLVRGTSWAPCWKKVGSHRPSTLAGLGRSLSASGGRFGLEYLAVEKPIRWWFSYVKSPVRGFFGCHDYQNPNWSTSFSFWAAEAFSKRDKTW